MNEERRMILEMVRDGSISIEEAERLMNAIGEEQEGLSLRPAGGRLYPKRIRVQATERGNTTVNVRIPFPVVKVALKLGKAGALFGAKYGAKTEEDAKILAYVNEIDIDEVLESLSDGEITDRKSVV